VWYMIRNLRCTVKIDSVLANSKTQNAILFTVNAIFRQSRLPPSGGTWKYAKAPSTKKLGEILYLLICSFLPSLSWLLRSRVRKSRRDLRITLYVHLLITLTHTTLATVMTVKENPNSGEVQSVKMMIYRKRVKWNNMTK
jgi:hypothetical protein